MRVLILDGYTDEPAGFGVPPYIDVYPRYVAGVFWLHDPSTFIRYVTVDEARRDLQRFLAEARSYDVAVVVAGAVVPGRYIGGKPITLEELKTWFRMLEGPRKILVGAAARWGIGNEGGRVAALPREVREGFDHIVTGDPEAFLLDALRDGFEKAAEWRILEDLSALDKIAVKGARIVEQHPSYGYNLIAELETYRSCSRWVTGGCSFCVTKLYGRPRQRTPKSIVHEVEALYTAGVRHFRVGRQADILVYGSPELGSMEWPRPSPEALRQLLYGIRVAAPGLKTLHIDNVNPGTIVRHRESSIEALKTIVEYHTPGDVAALGIETADPRVVKLNNLKTEPEESLEAIRIVHRVGARHGYNGLPELLPGINFVVGLPGETAETYRLNTELLRRVEEEGLLVRRVNVRKVLVLPGTMLAARVQEIQALLRRHEKRIRRFQRFVMEFSTRMLRRLVPPGTVLRSLYVERYEASLGATLARQAGSYPLVAELPCKLAPPQVLNVYVYGYAGRSVRAVPVPLDPHASRMSVLSKAFGRQAALRLKRGEKLRGLEAYTSPGGFAC